MEKRFKVYEFIAANHLYPAFVKWSKDHPIKSRYKRMYCFIVHLKRVDDLKHPLYDRKDWLNILFRSYGQTPICDLSNEEYDAFIHAKWFD